MDTTRWKSILVPRAVYEEIKALSKAEGRTIGGQLRLVFDRYKKAQEVQAVFDRHKKIQGSRDARTPQAGGGGDTQKAG